MATVGWTTGGAMSWRKADAASQRKVATASRRTVATKSLRKVTTASRRHAGGNGSGSWSRKAGIINFKVPAYSFSANPGWGSY